MSDDRHSGDGVVQISMAELVLWIGKLTAAVSWNVRATEALIDDRPDLAGENVRNAAQRLDEIIKLIREKAA